MTLMAATVRARNVSHASPQSAVGRFRPSRCIARSPFRSNSVLLPDAEVVDGLEVVKRRADTGFSIVRQLVLTEILRDALQGRALRCSNRVELIERFADCANSAVEIAGARALEAKLCANLEPAARDERRLRATPAKRH